MKTNGKIQLLSPQVANQIAAGEVIQRPANVLKELLENSVDAGATAIQILLKDGGKTLIQVVDNGSGMNEKDALACFERHATSKITSAEDLFNISTKGFRGEAMASIASIAHIELKTRTVDQELAHAVTIEGGKVKLAESCQHPEGTNAAVKHLFYNVPARRKFLKSDAVETKHLLEEFSRVALIHPHIHFTLHQDDEESYNLPPGTFKHRIIGLFGKNYREKLVPIEEKTDIIRITGFILKPESCKKSRGEQFFFANGRFVKHSYFHHAIANCFEGLLASGAYPSYFIQLEVDPKEVDVNIHPTKIEVKFTEERSIYAILTATVRKALNQYHLTPTLDFDQETSFNHIPFTSSDAPKEPEIKVDKNFNPFKSQEESQWKKGSSFEKRTHPAGWEKLYEDDTGKNDAGQPIIVAEEENDPLFKPNEIQEKSRFFQQLQKRYILTEDQQGLIIVNQRRAHERVLFDHFCNAFEQKTNSSQQLLFPEVLEFPSKDFVLLKSLLPDLEQLGFRLHEFGKSTVQITAVPADLSEADSKSLIEEVLAQYQVEQKGNSTIRDNLAKALSQKLAIRQGHELLPEEMETLVVQLMACKNPYSTPSGKPIYSTYPYNLIDRQLG